jgi:Tat protein secretion system quality control protein TatD with DNase activity
LTPFIKIFGSVTDVKGIPVERMMIETDSPYCKIKNTHAGIGFVNLRDLLRRKRSMIKSASSKAAMSHVQLGKWHGFAYQCGNIASRNTFLLILL